jgi:hypothetical protein
MKTLGFIDMLPSISTFSIYPLIRRLTLFRECVWSVSMYFNLLNNDSGAALQTVDRAIVVWGHRCIPRVRVLVSCLEWFPTGV